MCTLLPGQRDDVRRTLAHDLGDVHRAVDPTSDGDGPEHSLSLQLGTHQVQQSQKVRGTGTTHPKFPGLSLSQDL